MRETLFSIIYVSWKYGKHFFLPSVNQRFATLALVWIRNLSNKKNSYTGKMAKPAITYNLYLVNIFGKLLKAGAFTSDRYGFIF